MKITVSVSGKFSMGYLWAAYLERQGMLERLITPLPYNRGEEYGVSRERTECLWPIGGANHVLQRYTPKYVQASNQMMVSAAYDEWASRKIGECDVFNGWASMSLRSIRAARTAGVPSVLQMASAHIMTQTELLNEESRRWGIETPVAHPGVAVRTMREYEEADMLAAPSEFVRRTLIDKGVKASKIKVVAWGVHPVTGAGTATDAAEATSLRSSEGGGGADRPLRVLFVGAVGVRKGVPYLLQAFDRLDARATLRMVGPTDRRFMKAIGDLPDNVEAVGVKTGDALAAEFRAADVFVLPSIEDGYGVVTTEAMAAGLPVIVTENCGSADAVRDGENGFVVPARDTDALREKLELLLADAALRARIGAAASKVTSWSWEESGAAHLREIYEPLMSVRKERGTLDRAA